MKRLESRAATDGALFRKLVADGYDRCADACCDTNDGAEDSDGDDCAEWTENGWLLYCGTKYDDDDLIEAWCPVPAVAQQRRRVAVVNEGQRRVWSRTKVLQTITELSPQYRPSDSERATALPWN